MKLKERREALGYTQKMLSEAVGIDQGSISTYENGKIKPKYPAAKKLAEFYGCTVDEIMEDG